MNLKLKLKAESESSDQLNPKEGSKRPTVVDLGNQSQVVYISRFLSFQDSWKYLDYLDQQIPWTRPTIRVFGRSCLQPRDTCYVASEGLPELSYSGYQPRAYSWDDFPPLKDILDAVHKAIPGSSFNSLLLNRYKGGNDYVGWHADDEKLYGPTPEIASVSFGCEREFLLKKKPSKRSQEILEGEPPRKRPKKNGNSDQHSFKLKHGSLLLMRGINRCSHPTRVNQILEGEPPRKRPKKNGNSDQHSFKLKHGSLLLMRGYTQQDWVHSVPKRAKAEAVRINLTFRHVL